MKPKTRSRLNFEFTALLWCAVFIVDAVMDIGCHVGDGRSVVWELENTAKQSAFDIGDAVIGWILATVVFAAVLLPLMCLWKHALHSGKKAAVCWWIPAIAEYAAAIVIFVIRLDVWDQYMSAKYKEFWICKFRFDDAFFSAQEKLQSACIAVLFLLVRAVVLIMCCIFVTKKNGVQNEKN